MSKNFTGTSGLLQRVLACF